MSKALPHSDKRNQPRLSVQLRVDAKILDENKKIDILSGNGYPDLDQESLALTKPRRGHRSSYTYDVSASGLRLDAAILDEVEHGTSVELDVHLPGERRVVKVLAEVMWAQKGEDSPIAGLRFAALEDEGLRRLREYLNKLREQH